MWTRTGATSAGTSGDGSGLTTVGDADGVRGSSRATRLRRIFAAGAGAAGLAFAVLALFTSCDTSDEEPRAQAKRRATAAICDHEQSCQLIGPGRTYETRMDCEIVAGANLELLWPAGSCEERVSSPDLERCLADVREAPCLTASDFYAELVKCQAAVVCSAVAAPP